jgi:hypothetical protein
MLQLHRVQSLGYVPPRLFCFSNGDRCRVLHHLFYGVPRELELHQGPLEILPKTREYLPLQEAPWRGFCPRQARVMFMIPVLRRKRLGGSMFKAIIGEKVSKTPPQPTSWV